MGTGQTMITLGAFALLTTVLLNFHRLLATTSDDVSGGQDGILATSITSSYLEYAQSLAFDDVTDTTDAAILNVNLLTHPLYLGRDGIDEDSIHNFNDFDDFHNYQVEQEVGEAGVRFGTRFRAYYVNQGNVDLASTSRTFLKRLEASTWRSHPPLTDPTRRDTLKMSIVMGYFHFN